MYVHHTFATSYGPARTSPPARLVIPASPAEAFEFASKIDRQADAALGEGRFAQAECLSHLALEARCRATGERA